VINWKEELKKMKLEKIKIYSPGFYELSGGERMKMPLWEDKTANGLTRAICDYIKFKGGDANRISSTGMVRKVGDQMRWTHGNTRKGTADIHAIIKGRHVSIEVKIGKDQLSEFQVKEKDRIESAGGIYYVAKDMMSFVEFYKNTFENVQV